MQDNHLLTIGEATKLIPHSESKLRRDIKAQKVSATKDQGGNTVVDVAELQRVYGKLTLPEVQETGTATPKIVSLLESQLEEARQALGQATAEKKELLDLLKAEQNRSLALQKPVDETDDPLIQSYQERIQDLQSQLTKAEQRETALIEERKEQPPAPETKPSWWDRLTGRKGETQTAQ